MLWEALFDSGESTSYLCGLGHHFLYFLLEDQQVILALERDPVLLTLYPILPLLEMSLVNHLNESIALEDDDSAGREDGQAPFASIESA